VRVWSCWHNLRHYLRLIGGYSAVSIGRRLAVDFSSTANINYMWNYGSLTGISMGMQVATGLFVSIYIVIHALIAFDSVERIVEQTYGRHLLRFFHANICSFVFVVIFIHITKGI
jgi:quinol-cytochrome oxidoreductase complex cytochrome b subunit